MEEPKFAFLHNRKTGGTTFKEIIELQKQRDPAFNVLSFGHVMTFPLFVKTYSSAQAIFFVREPISRFVSGFYSRFRQGQPRYFHPWKKSERKAFAIFKTPNQLAEALSNKSFLKRWAAHRAMKSIHHVKHTYLDFLGTPKFLEKQAHRIAFIGHQPHFDSDLNCLRLLLNISDEIMSPEDAMKKNRNPDNIDKFLSETAITNLKKWYSKDFEIYEWCLAKRSHLSGM